MTSDTTGGRGRRALSLLGLLVLAACRSGSSYLLPDAPRYAGGPLSTGLAAPDDTAGGGSLRIVSFNIEFARRVDRAIGVLEREPALRGADVVLLQEMTAEATHRVADALGLWYVYYPAIYHGRARQEFGNAVLSRWPIEGDAKLVLPHASRYAGTHRAATVATIRVRGVPVRVYSVHLGTLLDVGGAARRAQLQAIVDDAAGHPRVIIGGDLNDAAVGRVARDGGYHWPTEHGPRTATLGRLDHIFLRGLAVPATGASGTVRDVARASDHRPVWAVGLLE